ncbi:MAG: hypothetical protein GY830_10085 [Bacteroidetes bacterium]|nr:hypothetical protein [Bacteroidota bacterium]
MLKKLLFLIFICVITNCNSHNKSNVSKGKKKEILKSNNSYTQIASKYFKRINNKMGSLNRKIKNSILPSFLLYNNLFSLSNSLNQSYVSSFENDEFFISQYLTEIDSETINFINGYYIVINQTNGKILDAFSFDLEEVPYLVGNSKKISSSPISYASLSIPSDIFKLESVLLNRHNFTDINYAKKITLPKPIYNPPFPLLSNNNSINLILNIRENEFLFMSFDTYSGENLYNRSYEFVNTSFTSHTVINLIEKEDKSVLLGHSFEKGGSDEGFIYIIEESIIPNKTVNFGINSSVLIDNIIQRYFSLNPYEIIKDEEDFVIVGEIVRKKMNKNIYDCFILKINSNSSKILNSKIIRDNKNEISCNQIHKNKDEYFIIGTIYAFEAPFIFISMLNSQFEIAKSKYYPNPSATDGFAISDIIVINESLYFSGLLLENNLNSGLFKIPENLEAECLLDYFNLTSFPTNITLGEEILKVNTNPNITIEDVEASFVHEFDIESTIVCKNGVSPTFDPTDDPTNHPSNFPTTTHPTARSNVSTNGPTKAPTKNNFSTTDSIELKEENDILAIILIPSIIGLAVCCCCLILCIWYWRRLDQAHQYNEKNNFVTFVRSSTQSDELGQEMTNI